MYDKYFLFENIHSIIRTVFFESLEEFDCEILLRFFCKL